MFGMGFIFDELPNRLVPFDYDAFRRTEQTFIVGTTDCLTGHPVYSTQVEVTVNRMEKDPQKLDALYEIGLQDAERNYDQLVTWVQSN